MHEAQTNDEFRVVFRAYHAAESEPIPESPFQGRPYACLLWDCEDHLDGDAQFAVATSLIVSGCRYLIAGGVNCVNWDDAGDYASVFLKIDGPGRWEEMLVMTMWFDGEDDTEEEVVSFSCSYVTREVDDILVLVVGRTPETTAPVLKRIEAAFLQNN